MAQTMYAHMNKYINDKIFLKKECLSKEVADLERGIYVLQQVDLP
jgi:hypothetical protein